MAPAVGSRAGCCGRGRDAEGALDYDEGLWFTYHLGRRIREKLASSTDEMDRPVQDLTCGYPTLGALEEPDAEAVLAEVSGRAPDGTTLSSYTQLNAAGSTSCGCWIYCGVYADAVNQAARRKPGREQDWVAAERGWAWPANRRVLSGRGGPGARGSVRRSLRTRRIASRFSAP